MMLDEVCSGTNFYPTIIDVKVWIFHVGMVWQTFIQHFIQHANKMLDEMLDWFAPALKDIFYSRQLQTDQAILLV